MEIINPFVYKEGIKGVVYGLASSQNPSIIYYVGATKNHPVARHVARMRESRPSNHQLNIWLKRVGLNLRYVILEEIKGNRSLAIAENKWYIKLLKNKHPLLNIRPPQRPSPKCGTVSGYTKGCRCRLCKNAHKLYAHKWRKNNRVC